MLAIGGVAGGNEQENGGYHGSGISTTEIRNKAKHAILTLLPYKIGYQHYLAEGVREDTLRNLYRELHLEVPPNIRGQEVDSFGHPEISDTPRKSTDEDQNEVTAKGGVKISTSEKDPDEPKIVVNNTSVATTQTPSAGFTQRAERNPPRIMIPQSQSSRPSVTAVPIRVNRPALNGSLSDPRKSKASEAQIERKELIRQKLAAKRAVVLPNSTRARDPPSEAGLDNTKADVTTKAELKKSLSTTSELEKGNRSSLTPPFNRMALESDKLNQSSSSVPLRSSEVSKDITASIPVGTFVSNTSHQIRLSPRGGAMDAPSKTVGPTHVSPKKPAEEEANHIEPVSSQHNGIKSPKPITSSSSPTEAVKEQQDAGNKPISFSGIPGLFMSLPNPQEESTKPIKPALSSLLPQARVAPHKRPVAADFDTEPPPLAASFKRPFGHSRVEQPLVINVSDEESADENEESRINVDIDHPLTKSSQSTQAQAVPGQQKRMSIRDMPPLTDLPPARRSRIRTSGFGRTSTPGTPSIDGNGGKGKSAAQEDLKRTEEQIQLMQKKIAELELRKALASKSRADTPVKPTPLPPPSKPPESVVAREGSMQTVSDKIPTDRSPRVENANQLAAAKAVEAEERRKLIQAKTEERNRRRAQIESDLSQTRVEVEKGWQRLEELREEEKRCQTTFQEASSKKLKLEEELQKLEMEEKSSVDEADKELVESKLITMPEAAVSICNQPDSTASQEQSTGLASMVLEMRTEHAVEPALMPGLKDHPQVNGSIGSSSESTVETLETDINPYKTGSGLHIAVPQSSAISDGSSQNSVGKPHASELPESSNGGEKAGSDIDMTEPPASSEPIFLSDNMDIDPKENLIHISEVTKDASINPTKEGETEQDPSSTASAIGLQHGGPPREEENTIFSNQISEESDAYEPPEQMPSDPLNQQTMIDLPFSSAASQTPSSYSPTLESPSPGFPDESPVLTSPAIAASNMLVSTHETDQAPIVNVDTNKHPNKPDISSQGYFKPYVSPLRQFRSYRYHPKYLEEVSEGFRSLTFSHKINPTLPLCTYEASGGICNDDSCGGQHFRDMGLSDDLILAQIVSVREGTTPQEESQYMDGLRQALKELRVNKVKDISTVATKIAAYRSSFLKDPSRVLILNPQKAKAGGQ